MKRRPAPEQVEPLGSREAPIQGASEEFIRRVVLSVAGQRLGQQRQLLGQDALTRGELPGRAPRVSGSLQPGQDLNSQPLGVERQRARAGSQRVVRMLERLREQAGVGSRSGQTALVRGAASRLG